ncbi:MAG: leader peptidase (prepilin peptidase) / N-methyltransferase [Actinomycetota bacterium]|jgi:leader peptidase (prepilin peptidase)/N-methyltransferase|nr:leader peptidase (prepilin peptidase) / N-methyltransferase [Actinomycetota bacterium]
MDSLTVPAASILVLTLVVATVTDLRNRVIPNWLVGFGALAGLAAAIVSGRPGQALLAGVLAATPFLAAALIRPEGMGMGDVKLAGVIGIYLGQSVWPALALGLGLAGLTGVLISLGRRQPPSRVALPLAPFLALGAGMMLVIGGSSLQ